MSPFHCTCPHCSARLGSACPVPPGRSLKCPRCSRRFTVRQTGTTTLPTGLAPPVEFGIWKLARSSEPSANPVQLGAAARLPGRVFAGAALLLAFVVGMAAAGTFSNKPPASAATVLPPTPAPVSPAPAAPLRKPAPPKPAAPVAVPTPPLAAPSAKQLLVGRWQGRRDLPELRLTIPLLVVFEKDDTFSMTFAPLPDDPVWKPYRGLRYDGVCKFRSPAVADLDWKTPPQGIDVGIETCTLRFVDRDLVIFTNVVTGARREFRRIKG